jgi:hypothetical protein
MNFFLVDELKITQFSKSGKYYFNKLASVV